MKLPSAKATFYFGALFSLLLLFVAAFLQYALGHEPCPLCIAQRMVVLLIGFTCLAAALHNPRKTGFRIYGVLLLLLSALGTLFAGRQVWLQHLPADKVPACGPDFTYILTNLPFNELIKALFHGTEDCAAVSWQFLSLSIPEWTLGAFCLFVLIALWQLGRKH